MPTPLEILRFNLQERQYPYFDEVELNLLLQTNDNNVNKASWKGCVLKANADDAINIGPLRTDSNREYWLGLAEEYKSEYEKANITSSIGVYKTSMRRADGQ